jgi:hypothetical protein
MNRALLLWALIVTCAVSLHSQTGDRSNASAAAPQAGDAAAVDPVKQADIQRLIELTNGNAMALQFMDFMEKALRPTLTNSLPPGDYRGKLLDLFFERLRSKVSGDILNLAVPVYDKYYSDDELKSLIQFYETPLGKKTISVMPKIMSEMQASGQKLGERAGRQAMLEILAEHPDLAEAMSSAQKAAAH